MINNYNKINSDKLCDLCQSQLNRFTTSYSVNLLVRCDNGYSKYTMNEIRIVCRSCYLTSDKIKRISALLP